MDSLNQYTETLQRSMRQDLNDSVNKAMLRPHDILTRSHESIMRDLTDPRQWYLEDSHRELVNLMQQAQQEKTQNQKVSSHSEDFSRRKSLDQDNFPMPENNKDKNDNCEIVQNVQAKFTVGSQTDLELKAIEMYQSSKSPGQHSQDGSTVTNKVSSGVHHITISDVNTNPTVKDLGGKMSKPKSIRPLPSHRQKVVTFDEHGNTVMLPMIKSKPANVTNRNIEFVGNWIHKMDKNKHDIDSMQEELRVVRQSQNMAFKISQSENYLSRSFPLSSLQTRNRILSQLSLSSPAALRNGYNLRQQSKQSLKQANTRNGLLRTLGENQTETVQLNGNLHKTTSKVQHTDNQQTEISHNGHNLEIKPNDDTSQPEKQHIKTFLLSLMDAPNGISETTKRYVTSHEVYTNEYLLSAARKNNIQFQKREKHDMPILDFQVPCLRKEMSIIDLNLQHGHIPYTDIPCNKGLLTISREKLLTSGRNINNIKKNTEKRTYYTETNVNILKKQTMKPMKTFIQLKMFGQKHTDGAEILPYPLPPRRMPRKLGCLKTSSGKVHGAFLKVTGTNDTHRKISSGNSTRQSRSRSKAKARESKSNVVSAEGNGGETHVISQDNTMSNTIDILTLATTHKLDATVESKTTIESKVEESCVNSNTLQVNDNVDDTDNLQSSYSVTTTEYTKGSTGDVDNANDTILKRASPRLPQTFMPTLTELKEDNLQLEEDEEEREVNKTGNTIMKTSTNEQNIESREEIHQPQEMSNINANLADCDNTNNNNNSEEHGSLKRTTQSNTEINKQINEHPSKKKSEKNVSFKLS